MGSRLGLDQCRHAAGFGTKGRGGWETGQGGKRGVAHATANRPRPHAPTLPRTRASEPTRLRVCDSRAVRRRGSVRFAKDEGGCYTVTGHILIAVNPFRKLGIYNETQA